MLGALRQIVGDVAHAGSFRASLNVLVVDVREALGTEVCSIYLINRTRDRFLFAANEGLNQEYVGQFTLAINEGLVGLVAERAEPINLKNALDHPRFRYLPQIGEEPFHAFLGVPIIHHRSVLGVLVVQQREERRFDESEEAFMVTLAAQLATLIAHAAATGEVTALTAGDAPRENQVYRGVGGSPGVAIGTAVVVHPLADLNAVPERETDNIIQELMVFDVAVDAVREDIRRIHEQFGGSLPAEELALFDVYLHMLDDTAIPGDVRERIRLGQWAQGALKQVIREHLRTFEQMEDPYLKERGADVKELGLRVLAYLQDSRKKKQFFPDNSILIGEEVTPGILASIPTEKLAGIVSLRGSGNSHVAILARSLGVPAVMGALDIPLYAVENAVVVVDGFYGEVHVHPSKRVLDQYRELIAEEAEFVAELETLRDLPSETLDGHRLRLWVNIGLAGDISRSLDRGAEGIGLFRTEVPFMTQDRFPTEEEQRIIYREHMTAFEPRPVTMRTLDIGGDKALSYFPIEEDNPFLGWRGIRVTLDHPEIFLIQTRAMIKANAGLQGLLRIMLPMISGIAEVDEAKKLILRAHQEVCEEGVDVKRPQIGVMIEVPAAVYQARALAKRVDFVAVGSNDLTQYMLAVDRNNPRVANLYKEVHPAVLQALREVAQAGHAEGKPVGICGEFAGTPFGAVLLMGMGYDVLSMNATNLPRIKWVIRNISMARARRMVAKVLKMEDPTKIEQFMHKELIDAGLGRVVPRHHE